MVGGLWVLRLLPCGGTGSGLPGMDDRAGRERCGASVPYGVCSLPAMAVRGATLPGPLERSASGSGVHRAIPRGAIRGGTHDDNYHHPALHQQLRPIDRGGGASYRRSATVKPAILLWPSYSRPPLIMHPNVLRKAVRPIAPT